MTSAKYTVPKTAAFTITVQRGHLAVQIDEVSMNGAKSFSGPLFFAAIRTAMLAEFDAAVKKAITGNTHASVPNVAEIIEHKVSYIGADGKPASIEISAEETMAHTDPIISTAPPRV